MICLRCGYCCENFLVVLPDLDIHRGDGPCKYLVRDEDGRAVCTIHGQSIEQEYEGKKFKTKWCDTPCGQFTQIESKNSFCRLGIHFSKSLIKGNKDVSDKKVKSIKISDS